MSEEVYAKLDLSKKVRFQKSENEDKTTDVCDDTDNSADKDNSVIYDNCYVEESSPPKPEDGTTEDQHKIVSVSVNPHKRNLVGAAAVLLVLLCLILLPVVIAILIQNSRLRDEMETLSFNLNIEKHQLQTNYNELQTRFTNMSRDKDQLQTNYNELQIRFTNMSRDKDQLQTNYNELQIRFTNMSRDKNQLQTNYSQVQTLYTNLTQRTQQLQEEKDFLTMVNNNLTQQRDSLKQQLETPCCPDKWKKFSNSCLWFSNFTKNWSDSNQTCGALGAQLVMIKTPEKQVFINSILTESSWIGLTNVTVWKWIDGTTLNPSQTFWKSGQPDNWGGVEHCAEIAKSSSQNYWNDLPCDYQLNFICEKIIQ